MLGHVDVVLDRLRPLVGVRHRRGPELVTLTKHICDGEISPLRGPRSKYGIPVSE